MLLPPATPRPNKPRKPDEIRRNSRGLAAEDTATMQEHSEGGGLRPYVFRQLVTLVADRAGRTHDRSTRYFSGRSRTPASA
jgi:hypothetical protein